MLYNPFAPSSSEQIRLTRAKTKLGSAEELAIMVSLKEAGLQYITNEAGDKTAVIVPIEAFEELLEDLEDLVALAERRDEPTVSHEALIAKLKQDGILPH